MSSFFEIFDPPHSQLSLLENNFSYISFSSQTLLWYVLHAYLMSFLHRKIILRSNFEFQKNWIFHENWIFTTITVQNNYKTPILTTARDCPRGMAHKILKYDQKYTKNHFPNLCKLMHIFRISIFHWYM